jgi:hypothetical protein
VVGSQRIAVPLSHCRRPHERLVRRGPEHAIKERPLPMRTSVLFPWTVSVAVRRNLAVDRRAALL